MMLRKLFVSTIFVSLIGVSAMVNARTPQEEENLKLVIELYDAGLNHKNWEKTLKYMGPRYDQHSIYSADQYKGLMDLVVKLQKDHPDNRGVVKRVLVQGDMVIMHMQVTRHEGHPGWSVIEMFRVSDGKAVEHWDIFRALEREEDAELIF